MIFTYHIASGLFWFRLFGHGLLVKDTRTRPLLFSERYGYRRYLRIGNYIIRRLKKGGI